MLFTAALTDEEVIAVNNWLSSNPAGGTGAAAPGLAFTSIVVNPDGESTELTWRSKPNRTYALDLSFDMQGDWQELNDEIPSQGEATTIIAPTFPRRRATRPAPGARVLSRARNHPVAKTDMRTASNFRAFVALASAFAATAVGQELAPDDPTISGNLGAWFRDAASTFDTGTGTWADSSGNGKDAVPVGEVNVGGAVTYVAPAASTISGGALSVDDLPSVHFTGAVDDMLVAAELNGGAGLTDVTIFVVYNVDPLGGNASLTRGVGIGSLAALQANPGDHFNLGSDPSIRKDNGQVGAGAYSVAFPNVTTFIRTARMSAASIDEWFNLDGTLQAAISTPGVSYTTSTDNFFMGDLRAGTTPVPGFGAAVSTAEIHVIQALVYTAALSDEQVMGVNEWLENNLTGGAGGPSDELAFTAIALAPDQLNATLTWRSKPNRNYAIDISTDLTADWQEINDEVPSEGAETTSTVPTFASLEPPGSPARTGVFPRAGGAAVGALQRTPNFDKLATMKAILTATAFVSLSALAGAATLAPNDPSIAGSLGLWLTDARSNFDGSTWTDSSGNGNDAVTVGTVNVNGPVTYSAPTLDLATTTLDQNSSSVAFTGSVDDLMRADDIFGGTGRTR